MGFTNYSLVLTEAERRALVFAVTARRGEGTFGELMRGILRKLDPEGLPATACPCKDPAPAGSLPCSPDNPCPYAKGRIADLWRA